MEQQSSSEARRGRKARNYALTGSAKMEDDIAAQVRKRIRERERQMAKNEGNGAPSEETNENPIVSNDHKETRESRNDANGTGLFENPRDSVASSRKSNARSSLKEYLRSSSSM